MKYTLHWVGPVSYTHLASTGIQYVKGLYTDLDAATKENFVLWDMQGSFKATNYLSFYVRCLLYTSAVSVSGRNCEYRQTDRPKIRANPIPESRHLFILCISPAP